VDGWPPANHRVGQEASALWSRSAESCWIILCSFSFWAAQAAWASNMPDGINFSGACKFPLKVAEKTSMDLSG
jgi:hypothetical protein